MRNTIRDLCTQALRTSHAIGIRDTPDREEIIDALDTLNTLIESLSSAKELTFNDSITRVISDSNGEISFGEVGAIIPDSIIRIDSIIDIDSKRNLQEINKSQFDLYNETQSSLNDAYLVSYINTTTGIIHVKPNTHYSVRYRPALVEFKLDDVFSERIPLYYWGMLESGLATLLAPKYGLDNNWQGTLFTSRKSSINDILDPTALLLNERRKASGKGLFNSGGF